MSSPPAHVSYSSTSTYNECPMKYRLQKILGIAEDPSVWLIGGSAFHEATELFDHEHHRTGGTVNVPKIHAEFHRAFAKHEAAARLVEPDDKRWRASGSNRPTKARPHGEDLEFWRGFGIDLVNHYIAWRMTDNSRWELWVTPTGQPAIELDVEHVLPHPRGGIYVKAFLDRVFINKLTGELVIVDLKSGKTMPKDDTQLGTYKVGLEARYNSGFSSGSFYNARKGDVTEPANLTNFTAEVMGRWYGDAKAGIEAGVFPARPSNFCKSCGVNRYCPSFSGESALDAQAEFAANKDAPPY